MSIAKTLPIVGLMLASLIKPIAAEEFLLDGIHTEMIFSVNHQGYSQLYGWFREFSGEISFDQAAPEKARLKIVVDTASIDTNQTKRYPNGAASRDETLRGPGFFNVKEFPTMTFESTLVEKTGDNTGRLNGNLTLLGVTKPMVFDVTFNKIAPNPTPTFKDILTMGFSLRGKLKRSEWGMKAFIPFVGDEVSLIIEAEAWQKDQWLKFWGK